MQCTNWHHGPEHRFEEGQIYMITAATLYKKHYFFDGMRLRSLQETTFEFVRESGWKIRSWSFFSNHYHLIAEAPLGSLCLSRLVQGIHSKSAIALNRIDSQLGRTVWHEFWDRCLTFESSYYARLNYVNHNPVHHGLVSVASHYPFCSASFYEVEAPSAFRRKLRSYKFDAVSVADDFEPLIIEV